MKNILADIKWVFIDIGSTLINQDDAVENRILQIQGVLEDSGISVPRAEIRAILQEAATEQALAPISRAIAKLTDSEELRGRLKAEVKWRKDLEKPYPEARQVLSALSERYRLGIIANQPLGTVARLDKWGLSKFVSLCLPSAEIGISKPDLRIFELAMERTGCRPEHAVMVGDRIDNDITPAKSLGWKTIRVKQGLSQGQVPMNAEQVPDFEVQRLQDVLDILL